MTTEVTTPGFEPPEAYAPPPPPPPAEEPTPPAPPPSPADGEVLGYDPKSKPAGWIALKEIRLAQAAERAVAKTGKATGFKVGEGWVVTEKSAAGKPTIYTDRQGIRHYTPESTMWKAGFEYGGKRVEDARGIHIEYATGVPAPGEARGGVAGEKPLVATTAKGKPVHITVETAKLISGLKSKPQFRAMVAAGIIEKGAEFVPGVGDKWSYISVAEVAKRKAFVKTHIELADGKWMLIKDWNKIPEEYKTIGLRQGFTAMKKEMKEAKIKPPKTPARVPKLPPPR